MRIAIYSDNFYPELSGIADSIVTLAGELAQAGHQVFFFTPEYSRRDFAKSGYEFKELDLGPNIKVIRFKSLPYRSSPTGQSRIVIPSFWRWLKVKKYKIDVIHTNSFFGTGLEALIAAKILKIPLVGTNHTPIKQFLKYSPIKLPGLDMFTIWLEGWYYNRCNFVTAPSNYLFTEFSGLKVPHQAVSNPLDVSNFQPAGEKEKAKMKDEEGLNGPAVIYIGRLAAEKNIETIIRAIAIVKKEIPDIKLGLTGHGAALEDLKKLTYNLGLDNNVRFFGFVPKEKLAEICKAADIFAVMSKAETQCLGMMQAMTACLPVVAANAGALPEYVGKDKGYIVEPDDYEALAEKIMVLCRNPELRDEFGRKGRELTLSLSADNIAKVWIRIYQEIINKPHNF